MKGCVCVFGTWSIIDLYKRRDFQSFDCHNINIIFAVRCRSVKGSERSVWWDWPSTNPRSTQKQHCQIWEQPFRLCTNWPWDESMLQLMRTRKLLTAEIPEVLTGDEGQSAVAQRERFLVFLSQWTFWTTCLYVNPSITAVLRINIFHKNGH